MISDPLTLEIAETRYMASFGIGIFESTALAFEYAHDEYENDDEEDAFTAHLAIESQPRVYCRDVRADFRRSVVPGAGRKYLPALSFHILTPDGRFVIVAPCLG
jgi:hypothetical protein